MATAGLPLIFPLMTMQPSSDCGATPCIGSQGDSARSNGPTSSVAVFWSKSAQARWRPSNSMKLLRCTKSGEKPAVVIVLLPPQPVPDEAEHYLAWHPHH